MKTLAAAGINGLTIERMAQELGVTKGSFYHHFQNARDFEEQLVAHWAGRALSTASKAPGDPGESLGRLDAFVEVTFGSVPKPEIAIRAWASQDEMVRMAVEQVDAMRQMFVLSVLQNVFEDEGRTGLMADMLLTMLVGSISTVPPASSERVEEMYEEFRRLYGLDTTSRQIALPFSNG
jgi:AcrR family transcriptional regulator